MTLLLQLANDAHRYKMWPCIRQMALLYFNTDLYEYLFYLIRQRVPLYYNVPPSSHIAVLPGGTTPWVAYDLYCVCVCVALINNFAALCHSASCRVCN